MIADVGAVGEFAEARPRIVTLNGQEIGIVRWGDTFYALRNRCPHMQAPLLRGVVEHNMCAGDRLGTLAIEQDRPVIGCPWHGWQFDLKTGQSVWGPLRVTTFRTEVKDDRVLVEVRGGPAGPPAPSGGAVDVASAAPPAG